MSIQPSLFTANVAHIERFMRHSLAPIDPPCDRLGNRPYLGDLSCFELCYGNFQSCCNACAPRPEFPLKLSTLSDALCDEITLPKSLYLWPTLNHSDPFSWIRAMEPPRAFWLDWARLTQRTVHTTTDTDHRGMCGFLTSTELPAFIQRLRSVQMQSTTAALSGLDAHEMSEHIQAFQNIIEAAAACTHHTMGLAWVHDFVI